MTKTVEFTSVHPDTVREFARANGIAVGSRGRYSEELKKAFNKGKRGHARYDESKVYAPHVTVTVKPKGKPPVRKTFAAPVLRAEMAAAGLVGAKSRGRIPSQKAKEYVLSTLA
jgi:2'-5' RNA ligase